MQQAQGHASARGSLPERLHLGRLPLHKADNLLAPGTKNQFQLMLQYRLTGKQGSGMKWLIPGTTRYVCGEKRDLHGVAPYNCARTAQAITARNYNQPAKRRPRDQAGCTVLRFFG